MMAVGEIGISRGAYQELRAMCILIGDADRITCDENGHEWIDLTGLTLTPSPISPRTNHYLEQFVRNPGMATTVRQRE